MESQPQSRDGTLSEAAFRRCGQAFIRRVMEIPEIRSLGADMPQLHFEGPDGMEQYYDVVRTYRLGEVHEWFMEYANEHFETPIRAALLKQTPTLEGTSDEYGHTALDNMVDAIYGRIDNVITDLFSQ